jgi:hypothetical protein
MGVIFWSTVAGNCFAQGGERIVHVEEDWELVIGDPDPDVDAPQVTCAFSPTGSLNGLHAAIELNHRSQPSFSPGGLQLQVWNGASLVTSRTFTNTAQLSTDNETVRWTQRLSQYGDYLLFEVVDGSSTTWGEFDSPTSLKALVSASVADLNAYHPDVSAENSGVGFAGNRVQSLVLKEVRLTTESGTVLRDTTPRVVHQQ